MSESVFEETSHNEHAKPSRTVAEAPKSNDRRRPNFATKPVRTRITIYEAVKGTDELKIKLSVGRAHGVYPDMLGHFVNVPAQGFKIDWADEGTSWAMVKQTGDFILENREVEIHPVTKPKMPLPKRR